MQLLCEVEQLNRDFRRLRRNKEAQCKALKMARQCGRAELSPLDQGWKSCPVINSAAIFFPLIDLGVHRFNYEIASHGQSLLGLTWHVMFYYGLQWLALSSQSLT